jgi:hypothetical protein
LSISLLPHLPHRGFHLLNYFSALLLHPSLHLVRLQSTKAILLIDVAVALLLHPVLENHGGTENEDEVDADDTKGSSEDLIEIPVGE